jgi:MFS superfamily sulfate permease-like transporter
MGKKDLSIYKRRYDIFRHHAWAGTVFLSVLLALRYLITSFPRYIFIPLCTILIIYILISLIFTYKYRTGLYAGYEEAHISKELEEVRRDTQAEKERIKAIKKISKTEMKAKKKEHGK